MAGRCGVIPWQVHAATPAQSAGVNCKFNLYLFCILMSQRATIVRISKTVISESDGPCRRSDTPACSPVLRQGPHVDQIKQYRRDCLRSDVLISRLEQDHPPVQPAPEGQLRAAQRDNKAKDKTIMELSAPLAPAEETLCSGHCQDLRPVACPGIACTNLSAAVAVAR